jgi:hypothetical protein
MTTKNELQKSVEHAKARLARLEARGLQNHPQGTWQWQTYQMALAEMAAFQKQLDRAND